MSYTNWLATLKIGDEWEVVRMGCIYTIRILRETKTRWVTNRGEFLKDSGESYGSTHPFRTLPEPNPEAVAAARAAIRINILRVRCANSIRENRNLTMEQLESIAAILGVEA